jgi:hypothetical protein
MNWGFRSAMKEPPADRPQKPSKETVLVRTDRGGWSRWQPGRAAHGITRKRERAAAR